MLFRSRTSSLISATFGVGWCRLVFGSVREGCLISHQATSEFIRKSCAHPKKECDQVRSQSVPVNRLHSFKRPQGQRSHSSLSALAAAFIGRQKRGGEENTITSLCPNSPPSPPSSNGTCIFSHSRGAMGITQKLVPLMSQQTL